MMKQSEYPLGIKIFDPGKIIETIDHPIFDYLNQAWLKKILQYSDQAIVLINHSTFQYPFVSNNLKTVLGYDAEMVMQLGLSSFISKIHATDVEFNLHQFGATLLSQIKQQPTEHDKLRVKSSLTYRLKQPDGTFRWLLQQNHTLTIENDYPILGMALMSNISAYKKDDQPSYRISFMHQNGSSTLLASSNGNLNLFTSRETEILSLTADGFSEKEISEKLVIDLQTVKSHKKSMLRKSGVKNSAELVRYGLANLMI